MILSVTGSNLALVRSCEGKEALTGKVWSTARKYALLVKGAYESIEVKGVSPESDP